MTGHVIHQMAGRTFPVLSVMRHNTTCRHIKAGAKYVSEGRKAYCANAMMSNDAGLHASIQVVEMGTILKDRSKGPSTIICKHQNICTLS